MMKFTAWVRSGVLNRGQQPTGNGWCLKWLRNRALLTGPECAQAIGVGVTTYMRYEDDRYYDAEAIPVKIILPLIPLLVGQGSPPIRLAEVLEISELDDALRTRRGAVTGVLPNSAPALGFRAAAIPCSMSASRAPGRDAGLIAC
jgi:DNA-binding XRE family transcriptional regulator